MHKSWHAASGVFPCAVLALGKGRGGLGFQPQQFPITAAENSKVPHPRSAEE
jgi:hypothetical protein